LKQEANLGGPQEATLREQEEAAAASQKEKKLLAALAGILVD